MMAWVASVSAGIYDWFRIINADVLSATNSDPSANAVHDWLEPSPAKTRPESTDCKPGGYFRSTTLSVTRSHASCRVVGIFPVRTASSPLPFNN